MQIISHSEVEAYSLCERRHFYAFGEKLTRIKHSDSLTRGIAGHDGMLNSFFKTLQRTGSWDDASDALEEFFGKFLIETATSGGNILVVNSVIKICRGWLEYFKDQILEWEILEVEQTRRLDMGEFQYAYKPDLVVNERGYRTIIDLKFVYDMYHGDMLALLPQIPRYVGADRALGLPTRYGKYGFVRWRNLKNPQPEDLYQLTNVDLSTARIQNSFKDLRNATRKIAAVRDLPLQEWVDQTSRVANTFVCKSCGFKRLCTLELDGEDSRLLKATEYKPNDYGYTEEVTE